MGILDDVVINVKSAAEVVGKKAGQLVDISKLRINMSELNTAIGKCYSELGQYVYDIKKSGVTGDEADFAEKIAEIDDLYAQLSAVATEIAALQNKVTCPVCGKQCQADTSFCPYCGAKLSSDEKPAEPVTEEPEAAPEENDKPEE